MAHVRTAPSGRFRRPACSTAAAAGAAVASIRRPAGLGRRTAKRLLDAGGLDETLWSIGVVDDLAARLARIGADVAAARPAGHRRVRRLVPVRAAVRDVPVLAQSPPPRVRACAGRGPRRRRSAFRSCRCSPKPGRARGSTPRRVSFGGDWGRASLATRLRTRFGGPPPDALWPRDEIGTAVRLAALHAFAHELPGPAARRARHAGSRATPRVAATGSARAVVDSGPAGRRARASRSSSSTGTDATTSRPASRRCSRATTPLDLLELICVDNGSIDDSRDAARRALSRRPRRRPRTRTAASRAATPPASRRRPATSSCS